MYEWQDSNKTLSYFELQRKQARTTSITTALTAM